MAVEFEAGERSDGKIWIGFPDARYDFINSQLTKKRMHAFSMTIKEAKVVIEMLSTEIERKENNAARTNRRNLQQERETDRGSGAADSK